MTRTRKRRICFVTGTRAEFGLMTRTLNAIAAHPNLTLQIIATGMHLDRSRGYTVKEVARSPWGVSAIAPWPQANGATGTAAATGKAIARLATLYERLQSDIVLVVGDRVEAFAAAAAAHIAGRCVAHVHGGDRALGQVDDALRHAISKLAHVHFPATPGSADRLIRMGEERRRVHRVGSPGIEGIAVDAASRQDTRAAAGGHDGPFALVALHPVCDDAATEARQAQLLLNVIEAAGFPHAVVVYPNNDPGSSGIVQCYDTFSRRQNSRCQFTFHKNLTRPLWLGLLRDAAILIGNSSSGIIEAASFGTPVIDVGPRQQGREHGLNVRHVEYKQSALLRAVRAVWGHQVPLRFPRRNLYGNGNTGARIAKVLATMPLDNAFLRKLIAY